MNTRLNTRFASVITLALATLAAGDVLAQDPAASKTRAQVRAELLQAQRTGDLMVDDLGQKLNEIFPGRYPAKAVTPSRTRAEVKAELLEARRRGDIIMTGESGLKLNETYPGLYKARSRAE